ncbi:Abi-alpha family protein [Pseudonocardia sp.]|uniref:Abi-alpha family protein n=1 Tax=Pseudonocardia sp. TaxID=60912 RepID=UPI0026397068|nr:Abi-alpha family protein [Pseudonocardia sp.]
MPSETTPQPDGLPGRAGSLVGAAGSLARWATRTSTDLARRLPGAAAIESELVQLERVVLTELRRRLDNVDPLGGGRPGDGEPVDNPTRNPPPPKQTEPLRVAMAELLMRSLEQSTQRAREYLYLSLLRQLVPDEARILSALADGSVYPVVHVDVRTGVSGSRRLLSNASSVGRAAGVAVPASVPRYVQRLLHFDLVEIGAHDPELTVQYDILMTDQTLREAEEAARTQGRARFVRRTLRIAPLGRDLWDACHPYDEPSTWPDAARHVPTDAQRRAWDALIAEEEQIDPTTAAASGPGIGPAAAAAAAATRTPPPAGAVPPAVPSREPGPAAPVLPRAVHVPSPETPPARNGRHPAP